MPSPERTYTAHPSSFLLMALAVAEETPGIVEAVEYWSPRPEPDLADYVLFVRGQQEGRQRQQQKSKARAAKNHARKRR